jgi:Fe2+ or Zn2+ uptake regulation protein/O6-methylguanine-DNA--protein-cysteine methyltransferase
MEMTGDTAGAVLRSHGLRSTPQRRAILTAFAGADSEHLSADQVHAQASRLLPDLSRGTVYATLAELTDLGLLNAVGHAEPVRYETNTSRHDHFRCRLCLRLFDLSGDPPALEPDGLFMVERVELSAEGICAECGEYQAGLQRGVRSIHAGSSGKPWSELNERSGLACVETSGPLGSILLAGSPDGLLRLAFEDHADIDQLRAIARSRRGGGIARRHLSSAVGELERYLSGETFELKCEVDDAALADGCEALAATTSIPYAGRSSYSQLRLTMPPREIGLWMGANPIPIVYPCHRVSRGTEIPEVFVGGLERRDWLEALERRHDPTRPGR